MSYLLFVEESGLGTGHEVLAGVAIHDSKLWPLITKLRAAEIECFGRRYTEAPDAEAKGKKLLKRKVFRLARQLPEFEPDQRAALAKACLDDGGAAGKRQMTALAQAKLTFVEKVLALSRSQKICTFASIVPRQAPRPSPGFLRKDYSYLFERFFYFLEDRSPSELGLVIFDELEKSRSHILVNQMATYFQRTETGRERSARIIPEPFFVHSDLTTAIQVADLVAYITAQGMNLGRAAEPPREELADMAKSIRDLQHRTRRGGRTITSFKVIEDLRTLEERAGRQAWQDHKAKKKKAMPVPQQSLRPRS